MPDPALFAADRYGCVVQAGPFRYTIHSDVPALIVAVRELYADRLVAEAPPFADFHMALTARRRLSVPWRSVARLSIEGQLLFEPFPVSMAFAYLEWGMNRCIAQTAHQYLMLHAAVVERGGRAAILTGPPGTGKSTLCAALAAAGWRLYSDELALITPASGTLTPLGRAISLKNESIELMQRLAPDWRFGPLCEGGRKGRIRHMALPLEDLPRIDVGVLPAWFLFVRYAAGSATLCEPLDRGPCMMRAIEQCFNYGKLGPVGFRTLADVVERCDCFELTYSDTAEAVAAMQALAAASGPVTSHA